MGKETIENPFHFGLVGLSLKHSFSKDYFLKKFELLNLLNHTYDNFEIKNIKELAKFCSEKKNILLGFNVTIPYKEHIIPFLDEMDSNALQIGAVNTVLIKSNKLIGFNTDYIGFMESLKPFLRKHHKKALILGTGGASKAVAYGLKMLNISYIFISRDFQKGLPYHAIDQNILKEYQIIINTTPIGTFPTIDKCPEIPYHLLNNTHLLFDLVYNPLETKFLNNGKNHNAVILNGLNMLEIQAEKAWEIWNSDLLSNL